MGLSSSSLLTHLLSHDDWSLSEWFTSASESELSDGVMFPEETWPGLTVPTECRGVNGTGGAASESSSHAPHARFSPQASPATMRSDASAWANLGFSTG